MRDTDCSQVVVALYDQLVRLGPSPIIALNRAIAVAELDGPEAALAAVDRLEDELAGYHAYHATRADLLRRLGCSQRSRGFEPRKQRRWQARNAPGCRARLSVHRARGGCRDGRTW